MKRYTTRILIALVFIGLVFLLVTSEGRGDTAYSVHIPMVSRSHSIELGTAVADVYMWDDRYNEFLAENFDRITPEVEGGYWYVYGLHNGWQPMDAIVQVAEENNQEVFYHCLRWWWETQPPDIRIWITEAMTRYPTITDWVVVNEGWGYCNQTIPHD